MDIDGYNYKRCTLYTYACMYGICGDVYDRFDYETHSKDKTMS